MAHIGSFWFGCCCCFLYSFCLSASLTTNCDRIFCCQFWLAPLVAWEWKAKVTWECSSHSPPSSRDTEPSLEMAESWMNGQTMRMAAPRVKKSLIWAHRRHTETETHRRRKPTDAVFWLSIFCCILSRVCESENGHHRHCSLPITSNWRRTFLLLFSLKFGSFVALSCSWAEFLLFPLCCHLLELRLLIYSTECRLWRGYFLESINQLCEAVKFRSIGYTSSTQAREFAIAHLHLYSSL